MHAWLLLGLEPPHVLRAYIGSILDLADGGSISVITLMSSSCRHPSHSEALIDHPGAHLAIYRTDHCPTVALRRKGSWDTSEKIKRRLRTQFSYRHYAQTHTSNVFVTRDLDL